MIFGETLLILFIASMVGVNICLNINQTELLELLDIPISNRMEAGIGMEQEFINYVLTFGLLATISLIAVWLSLIHISMMSSLSTFAVSMTTGVCEVRGSAFNSLQV